MSNKTKAHEEWWRKMSDSIINAYGMQPTSIHGRSSATTAYYSERLLEITKGIFKIKCPDTWDKDYILNNLIFNGYFAITDTASGVLPLRCSLTGVNVFELPTTAIFANPILGSFNRTIDEDCVVITLNGLTRRFPIYPIVVHYATKLADADAAIEINLYNSRTTEIYRASNKQEAASIQKMVDEVGDGKAAVFVNDSTFDNTEKVFIKPVKNMFISDDVQMVKRLIIEEFLTTLGVNNANTDKRERLNEAEVNSNNEELLVNTALWKRNLKEGSKKARKMFGIEFKIKMPYRDYVSAGTSGDKTGIAQNSSTLSRKEDEDAK